MSFEYVPKSDGAPSDATAPATYSANKVVGDIYPQGADDPFQRVLNTRGGGLLTTNSNPAVSGVDPLTGATAPTGTDVGWSSATRSSLKRGTWNGDFGQGPADPTLPLADDNFVPYWRFKQPSGTSAVGAWSSGAITLALASGAAGDDGCLEQLFPVNQSAAQQWAYSATANVSASSDASSKAYLDGQFVQSDGSTATGSLVTATSTGTGIVTVVMGATPTDAVYLRVRFGIRRDALSTGSTASRTFTECSVQEAPPVLYLSNYTGRTAAISASGSTGFFRLRNDALATRVMELGQAVDSNSPIRVKNDSGTLIGAIANGLAPFASPSGLSNAATSTTALNLAAVAAGLGGARAIPIVVPSLMLLESLSIWSTDTANLRTAEWALFWDQGEAATSTFVNLVSPSLGSAVGTFSFTPGAASVQTSTATGGPYRLAPGVYWLVIRNTSAARTFGLGSVAAGDLAIANHRQSTMAAITVSLDISAWTSANGIPLVRLNGRIGAEAAGFV